MCVIRNAKYLANIRFQKSYSEAIELDEYKLSLINRMQKIEI